MKNNSKDHWIVLERHYGQKNKYGRLIVGCDDKKLSDIVEAATKAGIPQKNWNLVERENDYSECYYEGDEPSIMWVFPLSVFD